MDVYKLSNESSIDITKIFEYGIENFGLVQAQGYLHGLHELFIKLAINKNIGRDVSELLPYLKRFVYKSHTIFYTVTDLGILIVRVLSQSMDYERHLN